MRLASLVVLVAAAGCSPELRVPPGTVVQCGPTDACPSGHTCVGTRCVAPELIDREGPALILPADRFVARADVAIPFAWGLVTGASSYTLTIAADASFANPVFEETAITDSQLAVPLAAEGTYYWRVSSDVTEPGAESSRMLGVVDTAMYVACDDDCAPRDDVIELGTRENPYRGVGRAVAASSLIGVREVHVASRPTAYIESFALPAGTRLLGGYSRDFTTRSGQTLLASEDVIIDAFDIQNETTVDGFVLRSTGSKQSTLVRLSLDSAALSFANVAFDAPLLLTPLITVVSSSDSAGPRLESCALTATADVRRPSVVLSLSGNGALQLNETTIDASAAGTPSIPPVTLTGVDVDTSTLTMRSSSLVMSGGDAVLGIRVRGPGSRAGTSGALVTDSALRLIAARDVTAIAITDASLVRVERTSVAAQSTGPSTTLGLQILSANNSVITDNVFVVRTPSIGAWVEGFNTNSALVGNTVVISTGAAFYGAIALSTGSRFRIANNVVIAGAVSGGYPAFFESGGGDALALLDNVFVGFPCEYVISGSCTTLGAAVGNYEVAPAYGQNTFAATLADVGLTRATGLDGVLGTTDDDYHPTVVSSLAASGTAAASDACTPARPAGTTEQAVYDDVVRGLVSPTCGGSTTDHDGTPRPNPPAIGAFEPR